MVLPDMARPEANKSLLPNGQEVEWLLVRSPAAKMLRIKVGQDGIRVVLPEGRHSDEAATFLTKNHAWLTEQLERARRLVKLRKVERRSKESVLFRGESVPVSVVRDQQWRAANKVSLENGAIQITVGGLSRTDASRSLENWMRRQARERIEQRISVLESRVKRTPNRIYVMGQRTKWGNCSSLGNLSFNWRLVMAPDYVLSYIVTHEMTHLAIPDHSQKFWLTVQSLCPEMDKARQWLVANSGRVLAVNLDVVDSDS